MGPGPKDHRGPLSCVYEPVYEPLCLRACVHELVSQARRHKNFQKGSWTQARTRKGPRRARRHSLVVPNGPLVQVSFVALCALRNVSLALSPSKAKLGKPEFGKAELGKAELGNAIFQNLQNYFFRKFGK